MQSHQLIGIFLMLVGAGDILIAHKVVGPRTKDPNARRIVVPVLTVGGLLFLLGGAAVFYGVFSGAS